MKKLKKVLFLAILITIFTSCVTQNLNMSQGDYNKNQPGAEDKAGSNDNNTENNSDNDASNPVANDDNAKNENNVEISVVDAYLAYDIKIFSSEGANRYSNIKIGGEEYKNGFHIEDRLGNYCSFNLKGEYKKLTGVIGNIDGPYQNNMRVTIYGDKKELISYDILKGDLPIDMNLDVSGVKELKFEITKGNDTIVPSSLACGSCKVTK